MQKRESVPDMPALRQPERASTDRDLGPRVPTILVKAGKKLWEIHQKQITNEIEHEKKMNRSIRTNQRTGKWNHGDREKAHRFGWLEDWSHPDRLLEKKMAGMHLRWRESWEISDVRRPREWKIRRRRNWFGGLRLTVES